MSANDENRNPSNHGTPSINTAIGPKDREGDPAYINATEPSSSQGSSLQSPRAGAQATPSLPTIPETFGSISPTSPQYTLSQDGNGQGDVTPSSPEQHDTTSIGAQVTSTLTSVMAALRLSRTPSPPAEDVAQHGLSPTGTDRDDAIPPVSEQHNTASYGAQITSASGTIQQASDISASSSVSSYPSPQDDPQHPLSQNGVDEADFAPSFPPQQFEYSTVPAGLQNIREQDTLHMIQNQGDSSGQPAGDSAPPVPPRGGHNRQPSVDERSSSSGRSPCCRCDDPSRSVYMSTFDAKPIRACRDPPPNLNGGRFWNPLTQLYEPDVQRPTRLDDPPMPSAYSHHHRMIISTAVHDYLFQPVVMIQAQVG